MPPNENDNKSTSVLREFFYFLSPHKLTFIFVVVLSIILSWLNMSVPYALKLAVDTIEAGDNYNALIFISIGLVFVYIVKNACYFFTKHRIVSLAERIAFDLRVALMTHLHRLSISYYQHNKPGKISSRLIQDVESIKEFISSEFIKLFLNALMVIVGVIIIILLNPLLAAVALVLLPLDILIYRFFRIAITESAKEAKGEVANVSGNLIEQFSGIETLKSAASERKEQEKFAFSMQKGMEAKLKERRFYLLQKVSADMVAGLGLMILFLFGGYMVFSDRFTLSTAEFVAFYAYIGMLYPEVIMLVSDLGKFSSAKASFDRVYDILGTVPDVKELPDAKDYRINFGNIEMKNVAFSYNEIDPLFEEIYQQPQDSGVSYPTSFNDQMLFSGLNFKINAGEHVLISGPSGCGKSTLLNLIPRFYDPVAGKIWIDGLDNKQYSLRALRAQIGFVFQKTFIFNISVIENIRYARPDADKAAVKAAAKFSNAHEFIERLPQKYDTILGEGGVQLSTGEQQRIGLARAFLKNPSIFILDEALGVLDTESQEIVMRNLKKIAKGRTMLIVTHTPESFPAMDKELKLDTGEIIETR